MRVACIIVFIAFAFTTPGQSQSCINSGSTPNGQDSQNAAYIQGGFNDTNGMQCRLRTCPNNIEFSLAPATMNVSIITNEYCQGFNDTTLGCQPNAWVDSSIQAGNWYYKGCQHCTTNCDAAATVTWNNVTQTINTNNLWFFETSNQGKLCYILQCRDTLCRDPLSSLQRASLYAYIRPSTNVPTFRIPTPGNPWTVSLRGSTPWSEFDLPRSYACPKNGMAGLQSFLCYRPFPASTTYWLHSRFWQLSATTGQCSITECAGGNSWTPIASTDTFTATGNVNSEFARWVQMTCATQLRGCYSTPSKWRWNTVTALLNSGTACTATSSFCSHVSCECTGNMFTTQYTSQSIYSPLTGSGVNAPVSRQECVKAWCNGGNRLAAASASNNSIIDTTYYLSGAINCAAPANPPTDYYYQCNSNVAGGTCSSPQTTVRATQRVGVPVAYRYSSNPISVTNTAAEELFCSALGYGANYPLSASAAKTCYRSPMYAQRSYNGLSNAVGSCRSLNDADMSWKSQSGTFCPTPTPSPTVPTASCTSAPSSAGQQSYQYANAYALDKNWIEFQCFPPEENIKMEPICETLSSDRLQHLLDNANVDGCYHDRAAQANFYQVFQCRDNALYMSSSQDPTYQTDLVMQQNGCDYYRFKQVIEKVASCECQKMNNIYGGGSASYSWQMKQKFRTNFNSQLSGTSRNGKTITNLLSDMQKLGCVYRASCDISGTSTVTVERPKFSADYMISAPCNDVDWVKFRTNLANVLERTDIGGTVTGDGRFGGVQVMDKMATDVSGGCKVSWWTYFTSPELAKYFEGNLTSTAASARPALRKYVTGGSGVMNPVLQADVPSSFRTTSPAGRVMPLSMLMSLLSLMAFVVLS